MLNRHGLRDATLAVIAAEIGLNLKSLRYYFERREDFVAAAFMRSIDVHQELAQRAAGERGLEARIGRFVRDYFELQARVRTGACPEFVHFGDLRALAEPHSDLVWPAYNRMFQTIRQLFRTPGIRCDRSQLNAWTHMLLSQLLWSVVWFDEYFPDEAETIADRVADILLHGLSAVSPLDLSHFTAPPPAFPDDADRLSQRSFLRTATALINEFGHRGASVDRISKELNVTKGAFYHYNDTRDGLVVACFEHTFAILRAAQDTALASGTSGLLQIITASVPLITRQMVENGTLLRTSALTALEPQLRAKMDAQMFRLTRRFGDMLNTGLIDGSVRPCNLYIAAEMVTAMINSAEELSRWVRSATADKAASLYVRPLVVGILHSNA